MKKSFGSESARARSEKQQEEASRRAAPERVLADRIILNSDRARRCLITLTGASLKWPP